jgi:hypothetical protein
LRETGVDDLLVQLILPSKRKTFAACSVRTLTMLLKTE